jgi:hypothetical protein
MTDLTHIADIRRHRNRLLSTHLSKTVADYPLEVCAAGWGIFAGLTASFPRVQPTLADIPPLAERLWGAAMFLAALTMLFALRPGGPRLAVLARGLRLCGFTLVSFGAAFLTADGWPKPGTGILLIAVGAAMFIRASKLRADYFTALEAVILQRREED